MKRYIRLSVIENTMPDNNNSKSDNNSLKDNIMEIMKEQQPIAIKANDSSSKSNLIEIMKDLQPIAFLISMCLVVGAFYANPQNKVAEINLTNILMASLFFFLAYIGLFFFKKTNFPLFLYFGEISLLFGAIFVFYGFTGIVEIIDGEAIAINTLYITVLLFSLILISIMYLSGKVKKELSDKENIALSNKGKDVLYKKRKLYKISKILFHFSLIFFISYILLFSVGILLEFKIYILSFITFIINRLFFIVSTLSLIILLDLFEKAPTPIWLSDLPAILKNTGTFSLNPLESLEVIATQLVSFLLPLFSLCFLAVGSWLVLSAFELPLGTPLMLLGVVVFFMIFQCLIWYQEAVTIVKQILKHINDFLLYLE